MNDYKKEFPALSQTVNGNPLVYLDSAATTLKPKRVVDSLLHYYSFEASNVHRGAHHLSNLSTTRYEDARQTVADFLGAVSASEIVFTRGTTESINLVAECYAKSRIKKGDAILISEMEHHSNLVPWQVVAKNTGAELRYLPVSESGDLDLSSIDTLLDDKVKIVSLVHCSNTLGTVNPIEKICEKAHAVGAVVMVDAAQSVSGIEIDVKKLDVDFLCFSGHKVFAPFGVGVLYGKLDLLNQCDPYQYGGSMIESVGWQETSYLPSPQRFEAGTPNVGGAVALAEALNFVSEIGQKQIWSHERELVLNLRSRLSEFDGIKFLGSSETQFSLVTFDLPGIHPTDVGRLLNEYGVAVRTGMHCTQPLLEKMGHPGTIRASFSVYNDLNDVDVLVSSLKKAKDMLS